MENILAFIIVIAGVVLTTLAIRYIYKRNKARKVERERIRRIRARVRELQKATFTTSVRNAVRNTSSVPPRGKETTKKYTTTSTTSSPSTTTVTDDDGFLTGMLAGYAINSILHSKSESSEPEKTSSSSSSSSWGFHDEDSRKSASSSFGSSDSSSSWDSGSSDSGPVIVTGKQIGRAHV